jgi:hypothetical protein
MPSADQVPIESPHSTMLGGIWVVLIAGSTGSALRAVRPPNLHITPVVRRDLVYAASATGSLYRSPLAMTAHAIRARDGGDLGGAPRQQCCKPGPTLGPMDLGVPDDGERAGNE